ncbi:hypothetical protein GQ457_15G016650 [Hibiscus cannabinus]
MGDFFFNVVPTEYISYSIVESSRPTPPPLPSGFPSITESSFTQQVTPWLDHVVEQSVLYKKIIDENINATIEASRSRLTEIQSASSAHFNQTIVLFSFDSLKDAKSQLGVFEAMTFHKVKEGITIAASNPLLTGGAAIGLGFLVLKRPRRLLYYKTLRPFQSEESLISKADTRVKELRQSIDRLKAESEKLERSASVAEEELIRGRTKLRFVISKEVQWNVNFCLLKLFFSCWNLFNFVSGKQIRSLIQSAYKIERQAAEFMWLRKLPLCITLGLKDTLGGLPSREASQFRSQVSSLASQAKRQRNVLGKEVSKISNHGIAV